MLPLTAKSATSRFGFVCLKFSLLLILIFKFEFQNQSNFQEQIFNRDLHFCEQCFQHQIQNCTKFLQGVMPDQAPSKLQSFLNLLPISTERLMKFWELKTSEAASTKIISKSLTEMQLKKYENIKKTTLNLKNLFLESENLAGLQLCPLKDLPRFINFLEQQLEHCESSIWLHFMLDVEPLLMPLLAIEGFPVPKTYACCGFTLFQAYAGKALLHYYAHEDFRLKLKIAKELLTAVLKFSNGFKGFRIYITDLNADNIIWSEQTEQLFFVDLDSIIIVDSEAKQLLKETHKHVYIECQDCFAYSQQDICGHRLSDINIFAACQLLREDLGGKREGGFLYPMPAVVMEKYPQLTLLLDECVDCVGMNCLNRFAVTEELLQLLEFILAKSNL